MFIQMAMEQKPGNNIRLPPGFGFHPTDEELIVHYLRKKAAKIPLPASVVNDIELCKYNPWDLPKESTYRGDEWYFFTPRDRKYPNGMRPNRMAGSGYWKATGIDKPILSSCRSKVIGVKKALAFYTGRAPKGNKTNWIMLEYRLPEVEVPWPISRENSMRLDDWVLCRVREKTGMPGKVWEERTGPTPTREAVQFLPEHETPEAAAKDEDQDHSKSSASTHTLTANNDSMVRGHVYRNSHMQPLFFRNSHQNNYPSMEPANFNVTFEGNKSSQSSVSEDYLTNDRRRRKPFEFGKNDRKKATIITDFQEEEIAPPPTAMRNPNPGINGLVSYNSTTPRVEKSNSTYPGVVYQDICRLSFT